MTKKKSILIALSTILFFGSFFLTWLDYRTQTDLTGLDFVQQYRFLLLVLSLLAVILLVLGQYSMTSGLFVLLFLAELFYASARNMNRLAPGFYLSLIMTVVTGVLVMTLKDQPSRNILRRHGTTSLLQQEEPEAQEQTQR